MSTGEREAEVESLDRSELSNLCVTQIGGHSDKSKSLIEPKSDLFAFGFTQTKSVNLVSGSDGGSHHTVKKRKNRKSKPSVKYMHETLFKA